MRASRVFLILSFFVFVVFAGLAKAGVPANGDWFDPIIFSSINTANDGDDVQLRALLVSAVEGESITFEIWENDPLFDDYITTINATMPAGDTVKVPWTVFYSVGDEDVLSPEAEYYFKVIDAHGTYSSLNNTSFGELIVPPPDTTPPSVFLTSPANLSVVSGNVTISANASDDTAVSKVEFYVDGNLVGTDTTAPYSITWDSTTVLDANRTIYAIAYDTAANQTTSSAISVVTNNGNIDSTPPTVKLLLPKDGEVISGSSYYLLANASDNFAMSKVEFYRNISFILGYDLDTSDDFYSTNWNTSATPNGIYDISAFAVDSIGKGAYSLPANVTVDNSKLTVAIISPLDGDEIIGPATIVANPSDNFPVDKVEFYVDGNLVGTDTTAPYSITWDSTTVANGQRNITVSAFSGSLRGDSLPTKVNVNNPDTVPPTAPSNLSATAVSDSQIDLSWGASYDVNGVAGYKIFRDGFQIATVTATSYQDTGLSPFTSYVYTVTAFDSSGNDSPSASATATTFALPSITSVSWSTLSAVGGDVVTLIANVSNGEGKTVDFNIYEYDTLSSNDFIGTVSAVVSGGVASITWIALYDPSLDPAGFNNELEYIFDASIGSITTMSNNSQLIVTAPPDTTPPSVSIVAPADASDVTGLVSIEASASDDDAVGYVEFYVDGNLISTANSAPYTASWDSTSVADGTHTIQAKAYDLSSNSASASVTVNVANVDLTLPFVSIVSPVNNDNLSDTVLISVDASDASGISSVEVYIDGNLSFSSSSSPYSFNWDTTTVPNGPHTIKAVAYDSASNSASASIAVNVNNVVLDTTPPSTPLNLTATAVSASQIDLSWDASYDDISLAGYKIFRDGFQIATVTATSYQDTGLSPSTLYVYEVLAFDSSGNESSKSPKASATTFALPDTSSPIVSLTSPLANSVVSGPSVLFEANASDDVGIASVEFYVNGVLIGTSNLAPFSVAWNSTAVADGSYTAYARAIDTSSNFTDSQVINFVVNNTPASVTKVSGTIPVYYSTKYDEKNISKVEFFVDSSATPFATDDTYPYQANLDTTTLTNGTHTISTKTYDTLGNLVTESTLLTIDVQN